MTMTKPSNRWLGLLGAAFIMASVAAFSSDFSDITDCIPGKAVGDEQEVRRLDFGLRKTINDVVFK